MDRPTAPRPRPVRWLPLTFAATLVLLLAACSPGTTATPSEAAASVAESAAASESDAMEPSESEAAAMSVEITVSETSAGSALAGEGGMTLYTFDQDTEGVSTCSGGCVENWPPLIVDDGAEATAGEGVTGELGTITRDDGTTQVTYDGAPLYYHAGDAAAGDANGDGVGGVWHIAVP